MNRRNTQKVMGVNYLLILMQQIKHLNWFFHLFIEHINLILVSQFEFEISPFLSSDPIVVIVIVNVSKYFCLQTTWFWETVVMEWLTGENGSFNFLHNVMQSVLQTFIFSTMKHSSFSCLFQTEFQNIKLHAGTNSVQLFKALERKHVFLMQFPH
jgi:hypothetical protein